MATDLIPGEPPPERSSKSAREIEQAIIYERTRLFWFSHRQPSYIKRYVEQWGEWWDDHVTWDEEMYENPDVQDEDL